MNRILINSLCVVRQCFAVASLLAVFTLMSAETAWAQATMQVINNFKGSADYFSDHYSDSQVWLYFLNSTHSVTYISTSGGKITVNDKTNIKLSTVKDGKFDLHPGGNSSKVYAGLGSTSPFIPGHDGPGVFDKNVPYAEIEWTVLGIANDNTDVTYENTISFPTTLTVKDGGVIKDQATFRPGTQPEDIINALKAVLPNTPVGVHNGNYPKPSDAAGWGPLVRTVPGNENAKRWVGSSKFAITSAGVGTLRNMYIYAPPLKKYLQYLKDNETSQFNNGIKGWYLDYDAVNGYSGYLSITGDSSGYGLRIHDIRVNTRPSKATHWKADPNAGTAANGGFTVAANNATVKFYPLDNTNVNGLWTDIVIYSGAAILNNFWEGPVVTGTGDFAMGGTKKHKDIVSSMLATLSASMATGLLGSEMYKAQLKASTPGGTMYWFHTLTRAQSTQKLFEKAWPQGQKFYDPFWKTMAELTDMQGYLSPFNDRWTNFSPDFHLGPNYDIIWELGIGSTGSSSKLTAEGKIAPLTPTPAKLTPSGKLAPLTSAPAKLTAEGKIAPLTPTPAKLTAEGKIAPLTP